MATVLGMSCTKRSMEQRTKDIVRNCPNAHIVKAKRAVRKIYCPICKRLFATKEGLSVFVI